MGDWTGCSVQLLCSGQRRMVIMVGNVDKLSVPLRSEHPYSSGFKSIDLTK
jgi:hypothetical protein